MKNLTILGSTGSIGRNALDIISIHSDKFKVAVLTAGNNIDLLEKQIKLFSPYVVAVADENSAGQLRKRIGRKHSVQILSGREGIVDAASYKDSDFVLSAIVGAAGLFPTLAAIRSGKTIGLANKEALVMAGEIMISEAEKFKAKIIPVDSEHSAIFQCIEGYRTSDVKKIILTASGGPFAGKTKRNLAGITPKQALKHPKWKMGKKITIDSATLMNKGFEVIEAHYLFGLPPHKIDVLVHPQSIVHSIVEFRDRTCIAQMSTPDMKGPIAYALTYPERLKDVIPVLRLEKIGKLTFKNPDVRRFPCLKYAFNALEAGGTMPCVLNASNEVAVNAFLKGSIRFTDIPLVVRKTLEQHKVLPGSEIQIIMEADRRAREKAENIIKKMVNK